MADMFAFLQDPMILYPLLIVGALFLIYDRFLKKKENDLTIEQLKAIAWDYGRSELRKHTLADLDKVSHLFLNYNKPIYRQGFDGELKIGTACKIQDLNIPKDTPLEVDDKGKVKKTIEESLNYKEGDQYILIKYKTPILDLLDFFPFSIIVTDILGSRHYMMIAKSNILYHNEKRLMLNVKEFTQMFDIYLPVDNMDIFLPKLKDMVQAGFNEELLGRMEKLPSDVAQLSLAHTMNLAQREKEAEVLGKLREGQNTPTRTF